MNLAKLKESLLIKPPNLGERADVKVVIVTNPQTKVQNKGNKMILTMELDNGQQAKDALAMLKLRKHSVVSEKFPQQKDVSFMESKAPEVSTAKPNIRKLTSKPKLAIVEEEQKDEAVLPEKSLVPRLGEEGLELDLGLDLETAAAKKPRTVTKRVPHNVIPLGPEAMITIGDTSLPKRLPPLPEYNLIAPSYYMNNREKFVSFINDIFGHYKDDMLDESKNISCEDIGKDTGEIGLLTHQKIVRDYINLNTPYRGLLLFHGLGSGKTCSSIAIAEGIKSGGKQVIIMTPASLQRNYLEEIKKCGDLIYRKNQYWEWISTQENPEYTNALASVLGFKTTDYITRRRGAWLTNVTKPNNYSELSTTDKKSLNDQLDEMIRQKYRFINYNGLRRNSFKELTNNFDFNIFDNSIVIIDEAHNLISRIVNKLNNRSKQKAKERDEATLAAEPIAIQIYEYLMRANNCRVVLLTGTPIINYPNEIAVLFNILRGYIKTWQFPLTIDTGIKVTRESLQKMFSNDKIIDYIDYSASSKIMTITRNPFGFESKITESSGYQGVTNEKKERKDSKGRTTLTERGLQSDAMFLKNVEDRLEPYKIHINKTGLVFKVNKALPDSFEEFMNIFIDKNTGNIVNIEKFKRRIIGLTSYFRSAQEDLLPAYDRDFNRHVIEIPMSDYQFKKYEEYRLEERKSENTSKKKGDNPAVDKNGTFKEPSSTYRIFSRMACNFVMPTPPGRPIPKLFKNRFARIVNYGADGNVESVVNLTLRGTKILRQEKGNVNEYLDKMTETRKKIDELERRYEEEKEIKAIAPVVINKKELEKNEKLLAKQQQELEKEQKKKQIELEKEQKALAKQQQVVEKEALRALKEKEKEDLRALKEREKEEKALAKQREKEEKKKKGGAKPGEGPNGELVIWDSDSDEEEKEEEKEEEEKEEEKEEKEEKEETLDSVINKVVDDDAPIALQGYKDVDANLRERDELEGDEMLEAMGDADYREAITLAYDYLRKYKSQYLVPGKLETYSPKFLAMLNNIQSPEYRGLHLVYSQFRSMEGIGIFSLVLEANGFAQFKIKKSGIDSWELNMSEEDMGKPTFALYTGTEEAEEREIIRNIYNGMWDNIPNNIAAQLRRKSSDNNLGEIIKVLMITAAGSEGINLRNTRYVHIMEPYWHPVRVEQVIGRARRICSHKDLPKEMQTVDVFIYIMEFTQAQLDSEYAVELRIKAQDRSKLAPYPVQTSDQKLFEISNIKEKLSFQLLKGIKESSIDCATYVKSNTNEKLMCLKFDNAKVADFSYNPNYTQDENDTVAAINKTVIEWDARPFSDRYGKQYILRTDTKQVYDYENVKAVMENQAIQLREPIGKLVKTKEGNYEIKKN